MQRIKPQKADFFSNSLKRLVDDLTRNESFRKRYALIKNAKLSHDDVFNYQYFCNISYTRNLIYDSSEFSVILMCWQQNQESKIHDHSNSQCVMQCLRGSLEERRYKPVTPSEPNSKLECVNTIILNPGDITVINNKISLHKIQNIRAENALTLHFYFPGIQECTVFHESGETQKMISGYTSKYGVRAV